MQVQSNTALVALDSGSAIKPPVRKVGVVAAHQDRGVIWAGMTSSFLSLLSFRSSPNAVKRLGAKPESRAVSTVYCFSFLL
jgi:hypothetical protein